MASEDEISRQVARWAAKQTASERFGRQLTKDEQAFYDSAIDLSLPAIKIIQKILG